MAVFLTKKSLARRVYATILNAGTNTDGCKEQGGSWPGAGEGGAAGSQAALGVLRPGPIPRRHLPLRRGTGTAPQLPVQAGRSGPGVPGVCRSPWHRYQGETPSWPCSHPTSHAREAPGRCPDLPEFPTGGRPPGVERHCASFVWHPQGPPADWVHQVEHGTPRACLGARGAGQGRQESLGPSFPCPISFLQPAGGGGGAVPPGCAVGCGPTEARRAGRQHVASPCWLHGAIHFTQYLLHKGPARGSRSNRAARLSRLALPVAS